ncbi:MAG: N-acetylmuramic acid 6-phosphate etherase [Cytophagales bacterium]
MINSTESNSKYHNIDKLSISEIVNIINEEDHQVAKAVGLEKKSISNLIEAVVEKMIEGGRLFYIGAGTSGRLGVLDASEIPPTFGIPHERVIGLIAGGDGAIRKAIEGAEDDENLAKQDLERFQINSNDFLIGIAASGKTPYVLGGIKWCNENGIKTGCVVCNKGSVIAQHVDFPVEVVVGAEVISGSTRMKAGTAQKMVLNMITTTTMIKLGRVKGNKMVDMSTSNSKLIQRAIRMIADDLKIPIETAKDLLKKHGSVRNAIENYSAENS